MSVARLLHKTGMAGAMLLGVLALAWAVGAVVAADDMTLLFPADKAVVTTGTFRVIVKGGGNGALKVDGKPKPWEPFESPLRVAKLGLTPGMHELDIGGRKVEFVVGVAEDHEGPREWRVVRAHLIPIDRLCSACHQTHKNDGRTTLGPLKNTEACYVCHRREAIGKSHEDVVDPPDKPEKSDKPEKGPAKPAAKRPVAPPAVKDPVDAILRQIESCQTCHALHGSPRKGLLKPKPN